MCFGVNLESFLKKFVLGSFFLGVGGGLVKNFREYMSKWTKILPETLILYEESKINGLMMIC